METERESELAALLTDLLAVQDELLRVLAKKRDLLAAADVDGLHALGPTEGQLIARLQQCLKRRGELLERARKDGLPAADVRMLTRCLPREQREKIGKQVKLARSRARLLQHHSLTNWVLVQRWLIHLSHMLEIIATGGRPRPTYGKGQDVHPSGALVDKAV